MASAPWCRRAAVFLADTAAAISAVVTSVAPERMLKIGEIAREGGKREFQECAHIGFRKEKFLALSPGRPGACQLAVFLVAFVVVGQVGSEVESVVVPPGVIFPPGDGNEFILRIERYFFQKQASNFTNCLCLAFSFERPCSRE